MQTATDQRITGWVPGIPSIPVETLLNSLKHHDKYTEGHCIRVGETSHNIARTLATELSLPKEFTIIAGLGGIIHDIGKLSVPQEILGKPGKLTEEEYEEIKQHPVYGKEIIETHLDTNSHFRDEILDAVLHHHERYDGKGYPYGLKGKETPFIARVIAVADVIDAMRLNRCYQEARTTPEIIEELKKGRGTQFDPQIVDSVVDPHVANAVIRTPRHLYAGN